MRHYIHPKWVKSILFSLVIFLLLLTSGYAEENKTVRVVCSIMDTSSTGYKSGYSYEYFQRIAYLTGWQYEYVYTDFSTALQMLKDGEVDAVILNTSLIDIYDDENDFLHRYYI